MCRETIERLTIKEGALMAAIDEMAAIKQSGQSDLPAITAAISALYDYRVYMGDASLEYWADMKENTAFKLLLICEANEAPTHSFDVIDGLLCSALEIIQTLLTPNV